MTAVLMSFALWYRLYEFKRNNRLAARSYHLLFKLLNVTPDSILIASSCNSHLCSLQFLAFLSTTTYENLNVMSIVIFALNTILYIILFPR